MWPVEWGSQECPGREESKFMVRCGRILDVKVEGSDPSLTNQLQGQNTMWHCPLDIIVASGCIIISSKKVSLGEGEVFIPYCYHLFSLCSEIQYILPFFSFLLVSSFKALRSSYKWRN